MRSTEIKRWIFQCRYFFLVISALLFIINGAAQTSVNKNSGAVASAHPLATKAGLEILKRGGTAFDAAISIAATLNVVEPSMSGIGGYGTILIYDAKRRRMRYLNSSGRIPFQTNSDLMRPPAIGYEENRIGAKSVSTPGNLHAWEAMHNEYGKIKWKELFEPAIKIAESGFVVTPQLENFIRISFAQFSEYTKTFYAKKNKGLIAGDTLMQKDLAKTFRSIAQYGVTDFYRGEIADAIDKIMKERNGFLRKEDLRQDEAGWYDPIRINYKGYDIYTASPPSNAFAAFISLGLMQDPKFASIKWNSNEYYHLFAEITKQSYTGRLKYSFDPEVQKTKVDELLTPGFFSNIAATINLDKATAFKPFEGPESKNTTHFVVIDQWGNIVSATQTLGNLFGSRIMPEGTGIWLNNSLAYCTYEPKGNPMDAFPGHQKLSGDCPIIIVKDEEPWVAMGTPGGHTITQNIPQIIFNLIDGKLSMQEAINAPKIAFAEPDELIVEETVNDTVYAFLRDKGHKIKRGSIGNVQAIKILRNKAGKIISYEPASDKRGSGSSGFN
jgi:gamma-glutamyltranspeptidase/glutathione hydrolase